MVFLFPGILFRRAFFSGPFKSRFESGNPFERLLWNMLMSFIAIAGFCIVLHYGNQWGHLSIKFGMTPEDVSQTFVCMYQNDLPIVVYNPDKLVQGLKLLAVIYFFSFTAGFLVREFITFSGLEGYTKVFRFHTGWDNILKSNADNNESHNLGAIYYSKIDVKSDNGDLYTGQLHELTYDKDGKVEAFSISNAYKFYTLDVATDAAKIAEARVNIQTDADYILHKDTASTFVFRKRILGNILTILNNDLLNVSITYVKAVGFYGKFQQRMSALAALLMAMTCVFCFTYLLYDFEFFDFNFWQRVAFCLSTLGCTLFLLSLVAAIFSNDHGATQREYWANILSMVVALVFTAIPYLYSFGLMPAWWMIIFTVIFLYTAGWLAKENIKSRRANRPNI